MTINYCVVWCLILILIHDLPIHNRNQLFGSERNYLDKPIQEYMYIYIYTLGSEVISGVCLIPLKCKPFIDQSHPFIHLVGIQLSQYTTNFINN